MCVAVGDKSVSEWVIVGKVHCASKSCPGGNLSNTAGKSEREDTG